MLTAHARQQIETRMPGIPPELVEQVISKGGVTISSGWQAAGGWQTKEFMVFWLDGRPWVAILDAKTRVCLTVIHAWNEELNCGAVLYEKVKGENKNIGVVSESHIRRAIRAQGIEDIPVRFQKRKLALSARVLLSNGKIKVFRVERIEAAQTEALAMLEDLERRKAWREKVLEEINDFNQIVSVVIALTDGQNLLGESTLLEAPSVGGWVFESLPTYCAQKG